MVIKGDTTRLDYGSYKGLGFRFAWDKGDRPFLERGYVGVM